MKTLFVSVATSTFICFTGPAEAAVDVDPNSRNTSVHLEAERVHRPSSRTALPIRAATVGAGSQLVGTVYYCNRPEGSSEFQCTTGSSPEGDPAGLSEGEVLRAVREIGLPSLHVQIQPGEQTLVNVDTIFYAQPQPFERSINLVGYAVDVIATPAHYLWVHGDGTSKSTTRPGRPYPAKDVTHRYSQPGKDLNARVDVTYQVRYRVDGGPWQELSQTLLASGPTTPLDVREAAPVLARP